VYEEVDMIVILAIKASRKVADAVLIKLLHAVHSLISAMSLKDMHFEEKDQDFCEHVDLW